MPAQGTRRQTENSGLVDRGVDYVQRAQKEEDEIGAVSVSAPAAVGDRYLAGRPAFSFAGHLFSPLPPRPSVLSRGGSPSGPTSHRRRSDRSATHGGGQESHRRSRTAVASARPPGWQNPGGRGPGRRDFASLAVRSEEHTS